MFLIFIHAVQYGNTSFLFMEHKIPLYLYSTYYFIHSSVDVNLGWSRPLAIINNIEMNICIVYVFIFLYVHTKEWNCQVMW